MIPIIADKKMKIRLQQSQSADEEYLMIGISSSLRDYQLSFHINKHFQIDLKKRADIPFYNKNGLQGRFAFYHCFDEDLRLDYYLFANKSNNAYAVSAYPHFEFFILFKLSSYMLPIGDMLKELRSISNVVAALQIPLSGLKNFKDLLEDVEMHLLEMSSRNKKKEACQWLWKV